MVKVKELLKLSDEFEMDIQMCKSALSILEKEKGMHPTLEHQLEPDSPINSRIDALECVKSLIFDHVTKMLDESGIKPIIIPIKNIVNSLELK